GEHGDVASSLDSLTPTLPAGVEIRAPALSGAERVLTPAALSFVAKLHRAFESRRQDLLARRAARQREFDAGKFPDFIPEAAPLRAKEWTIAPQPDDLLDRRVEITGPVDRKMVINALNSGASTFMADFEDSTTPTWSNLMHGQQNLVDAVRRTISYEAPGRQYALDDRIATLLVRPHGRHMPAKPLLVDDRIVPGALFDFGLYTFHNARALIERGSGPYFYLPKMESHLEARIWNDVFVLAEQRLGLPRGTIK